MERVLESRWTRARVRCNSAIRHTNLGYWKRDLQRTKRASRARGWVAGNHYSMHYRKVAQCFELVKKHEAESASRYDFVFCVVAASVIARRPVE